MKNKILAIAVLFVMVSMTLSMSVLSVNHTNMNSQAQPFSINNSSTNSVNIIDGINKLVVQNITGISNPTQIAFDSQNNEIYIASYENSNVYIVNSITNSLTKTLSMGGDSDGIIYDPSNHNIYDLISGELQVINGNNTINTNITLSYVSAYTNNINNIVYDSQNNYLYINAIYISVGSPLNPQIALNPAIEPFNELLSYYYQVIYKIDPSTNTVLSDAVITGGYVLLASNSIVYNSYNNELYANLYNRTSSQNLIEVINPNTLAVITTISLSTTMNAMVFDPSSTYIFVALSSNIVDVIATNTNSILNTIIVGSDPSSLVYNPINNYVYVTNYGSNTTSILNSGGSEVINTIKIGLSPMAILYNPANYLLYIANYNVSAITIINPYSFNSILNSVSVGTNPIGIVYDPNNYESYVINDNSSNVSVINFGNQVIKTISVGSEPYGITYDSHNNYIYLTNSGSNNVSVINTTTNRVIQTISVGKSPRGIVFNSIDNYLYVANYGSNTISIISDATNTIISTISVGENPSSIAFDPIHYYLYVANSGSNNISVIDTVNNSVIQTINVGAYPIYVVYESFNHNIYVLNYESGTINIINTTTNTIVYTINVMYHSNSMLYDTYNNYLYVANLGSDTVSVINASTNTIFQTLNITNPEGLSYNPNNYYIYVTSSFSIKFDPLFLTVKENGLKNSMWVFELQYGKNPTNIMVNNTILPVKDYTASGFTIYSYSANKSMDFILPNYNYTWSIKSTNIQYYTVNSTGYTNLTQNVTLMFNFTLNYPTAKINPIPSYLPIDTIVEITQNSTAGYKVNITTYEWNITHNGSTSHYYTKIITPYFNESGTYNISLMVTNNVGLSNSTYILTSVIKYHINTAIMLSVKKIEFTNSSAEYLMNVSVNKTITVTMAEMLIDSQYPANTLFINESANKTNDYYNYAVYFTPNNYALSNHTLNFTAYSSIGGYNYYVTTMKFGEVITSNSKPFNLMDFFGGPATFWEIILGIIGVIITIASIKVSRTSEVVIESGGKESIIKAKPVKQSTTQKISNFEKKRKAKKLSNNKKNRKIGGRKL